MVHSQQNSNVNITSCMQMKNKWNSYNEIFPVLLDYQLAGYTLLFLMNNNKQLLDEVFVISGIIKVEVSVIS